MQINRAIKSEQQKIARLERSLAFEQDKKRRADTRRKIEFGGLVIKSAMDSWNKSIILGALTHAMQLIEQDNNYLTLFESIGDNLFLNK
jgi:hypothetical protein